MLALGAAGRSVSALGYRSDQPEIEQEHRDRNIEHFMSQDANTTGNDSRSGTLQVCSYCECANAN